MNAELQCQLDIANAREYNLLGKLKIEQDQQRLLEEDLDNMIEDAESNQQLLAGLEKEVEELRSARYPLSSTSALFLRRERRLSSTSALLQRGCMLRRKSCMLQSATR